MTGYRALAVSATALALVVVVVGAYVRLSDAGLGCPDWPLCYGHPVPQAVSDAAAHAKAWKEMGHRYLAGTLGLAIAALAAWSWKLGRSRRLASGLLVLVIFQATLGKWTVTMLLKPAIVTAHLLGGMATLALLVLLSLGQWSHASAPETRVLRLCAAIALAAVGVQIALGGWVSANYAALACPDLPSCLGTAVPAMDFSNAFHVLRELGRTGEGNALPSEALVAIHWAHRVFALVALAAGLYAAYCAWKTGLASVGVLVAVAITIQFSLGVANVLYSLPLPLAAAHNAGAALLLSSLVVLNFFSFRGLRPLL